MRDLLHSCRMFLLLGRLAVVGVVLMVAAVGACVHRVADALHYRTVAARITVACPMPSGDADCAVLSAMGEKPVAAADRRTTLWLRYFSPADGREHQAAVEREGDLSGVVRVGGATTVSANTLVAEKLR